MEVYLTSIRNEIVSLQRNNVDTDDETDEMMQCEMKQGLLENM